MSAPAEAARRWGLGDPVLFAHRENTIYRASDAAGRVWALRQHRVGYSDAVAIRSELDWLGALARAGVAVPEPRLSGGGSLTEEVDGALYSVISWRAGVTLTEALASYPDDRLRAVFHDLGRVLARVHHVSDGWRPGPGFTRRSWDLDGFLGEAPVWGRFWDSALASPAERALFGLVRDTARDRLEQVQGDLDYGLVHADALSENVLVDGTACCLIDFDDAGWGFRLFELATALQERKLGARLPMAEAACLDGYRTVRPIDLTHYPLIRLLRAMTYVGWITDRIDEPGGADRWPPIRDHAVRLAREWLDVV